MPAAGAWQRAAGDARALRSSIPVLHEEAERTLRRAAAIFQADPSGRTRNGAQGLNQLAHLLWDQQRYAEALPFMQASLDSLEPLPEVPPKELASAAAAARVANCW